MNFMDLTQDSEEEKEKEEKKEDVEEEGTINLGDGVKEKIAVKKDGRTTTTTTTVTRNGEVIVTVTFIKE